MCAPEGQLWELGRTQDLDSRRRLDSDGRTTRCPCLLLHPPACGILQRGVEVSGAPAAQVARLDP